MLTGSVHPAVQKGGRKKPNAISAQVSSPRVPGDAVSTNDTVVVAASFQLAENVQSADPVPAVNSSGPFENIATPAVAQDLRTPQKSHEQRSKSSLHKVEQPYQQVCLGCLPNSTTTSRLPILF